MLGSSGRRPFSPASQLPSSPVTSSGSSTALTSQSQSPSLKHKASAPADKCGNGHKQQGNSKKRVNKENSGDPGMPSPFKHPEFCKPAAVTETRPKKVRSKPPAEQVKKSKKKKDKAKFYESVIFSSDEELAPDVDADSLVKGSKKSEAKPAAADGLDSSGGSSSSSRTGADKRKTSGKDAVRPTKAGSLVASVYSAKSYSKKAKQPNSSGPGTAKKKVKKVTPAKTSFHQMLDFSSSDSDVDVAAVQRPDLVASLRDTFNHTRVSCSDVSETSSPPRQPGTPMRPLAESDMIVEETEPVDVLVPDSQAVADSMEVVPDSQPETVPGDVVPDSEAVDLAHPSQGQESAVQSVAESPSFRSPEEMSSVREASVSQPDVTNTQHSVHLNSYSVDYPSQRANVPLPTTQTPASSKHSHKEPALSSTSIKSPTLPTSQGPSHQSGTPLSKPSCITPKKQHTPRKAATPASPAPKKTPMTGVTSRKSAASSPASSRAGPVTSHHTPTPSMTAVTPKSARATPTKRHITASGSTTKISTPDSRHVRHTPKSVFSNITPRGKPADKKQISPSSSASDAKSHISEKTLTPRTVKGTPRSTVETPKSAKITPLATKITPKTSRNTPTQESKKSSHATSHLATPDTSKKSTPLVVKTAPHDSKNTPGSSRKTPHKTRNTPRDSRDAGLGDSRREKTASSPTTAEPTHTKTRKRLDSSESKSVKSKGLIKSAKKSKQGTPAKNSKAGRGKSKFFDSVKFSDEDSGEETVDGRNLSVSSSSSQASSLTSHSSTMDESISVLSDRLQKILGSKKPRKSHKKSAPQQNDSKSSGMHSDGSLESLNEKLQSILGSGKGKSKTKKASVRGQKSKTPKKKDSNFVPDSNGGSDEPVVTKDMSLQVSFASPMNDVSELQEGGHGGSAEDQAEVVPESVEVRGVEGADSGIEDPHEEGADEGTGAAAPVPSSKPSSCGSSTAVVVSDDLEEGVEDEGKEERSSPVCRNISLQVSMMSSPEQDVSTEEQDEDHRQKKPCDMEYRGKCADGSLNESSDSVAEDYKSCMAEQTVYTTPPQEHSPSPTESTKINDKLAMCFRDMSLGVSALHTTMDEFTTGAPGPQGDRAETASKGAMEHSDDGTHLQITPRLILADQLCADEEPSTPASADPDTSTEHTPVLPAPHTPKTPLISILASPDKKARRSMNLQVSFYPSDEEDGHQDDNEEESDHQHDDSLDVDDFIAKGSQQPSPEDPSRPTPQDSEQDGQRLPDSAPTADLEEDLLSGEDEEPIPAPHHKGAESSFLLDSSDSDSYNQLLEDRRRSLHIKPLSTSQSSSDSETSPCKPRVKTTRSAKPRRSDDEDSDEESPVKSVRKRKQTKNRKSFSESSDEELESFFGKMKKPQKKPDKESNKSLRDFIVDSEGSSPESSDDEAFHISTTQKLTRPSRMKPPRRVSACHELVLGGSDDEDDNGGSGSPSEEESDSGDEEPEKQADSSSDEDYDVTRDQRPRLSDDESDDDDIFLPPKFTPRRSPGRRPLVSSESNTPYVTPRPKEILSTRITQTPLRTKTHTLAAAGNNMRSHSTGHLPVYAGFLKSLTADLPGAMRHPEAEKFMKNFKKTKEDLVKKLFVLYNESVFNKKLPEDMSITWNSRLLKTAGFCAYKRNPAVGESRNARIELSVKVCDSAERVRDTLIHELCHAAVWLNHGVNGGHGPFWRSYAAKAMKVHQDLPPISRCHTYEINYKYTYRCTKCGYKIGRHSKSLDMDTKVCGYCHAPFELLQGTPARATQPVAARTPRTPNPFAMFVKENYGTLKQRTPGIKHGDVMRQLSKEFAEKNKVSS